MMWSRRFLWSGLASSVLVAAIAASTIWVGMNYLIPFVTGYFGLSMVGMAIYPLLWYLLVYRRRSYSNATTFCLIGATYVASSAIIIVWFMLIGLKLSNEMNAHMVERATQSGRPPAPHIEKIVHNTPFSYGGLGFLGAGLLLLPFVAIAGPLAFVHRGVLIRNFSTSASRE